MSLSDAKLPDMGRCLTDYVRAEERAAEPEIASWQERFVLHYSGATLSCVWFVTEGSAREAHAVRLPAEAHVSIDVPERL